MDHIPKKRGRKPKKKEIINDNPKFTNGNISENLVIKLNINTNEANIIEGYDNIENQDQIDMNETSKSELCWNCCHSFHNIVHGIPLKYINNVFYIYGDFCSLECASRYIYDNFKATKWEIFTLINLYHRKMNNNNDKINIPLSRLSLKIFGGNMTIEEYRGNFNNIGLYELVIPQTIPINHEIESYEMNHDHKKDLRLYRKKPLQTDKQKITNVFK
jgi:hypothetical protein